MARRKRTSFFTWVLRILLVIVGVPLCISVVVIAVNLYEPPVTPVEDLPDIYSNREVPIPPPNSIFSSKPDEMWRNCATSNLKSACDELYEWGALPDEYRDFASTCGGRVELIYEDVDCSTQLELQESPPTVAVLPWDGLEVKTFCIVSRESYDDVEAGYAPVSDSVVCTLKNRRLLVAESECDVTITVNIRGRAISASYSGLSGQRYTGAHVDGSIELTAQGWPPLSLEIYGGVEPRQGIAWVEEYTDPATLFDQPIDAPFSVAAKNDIAEAFNDWFGAMGILRDSKDPCY